MRNDNRIVAICRHCFGDDIGISRGAGVRLVVGQVHSHDVVAALLQLGSEQIPACSVLG
jgi:hypothetical protein